MQSNGEVPSDSVQRLRSLRRQARELGSTMVEDLVPFLQDKNGVTYRRLPYSDLPPKDHEVGVTVTCTVLMSLATAQRLEADEAAKTRWASAFAIMLKEPWTSSKLPECNKFTTILVLRTAGMLRTSVSGFDPATHRRDITKPLARTDPVLTAEEKTELGASRDKSITELADMILATANAPETIRVGKYLPTSTLTYWLIDAIDMLGRPLTEDQWSAFARWVAREFSRQVSLVTSEHGAMMDPLAMTMAACLALRLRRIAPPIADTDRLLALWSLLPSSVELINALRLLFQRQEPSGIWPKYFPLFHYPDAGANYCFSFEMLEAVLNEFQQRRDEDADIFSDDMMLRGFERAVEWVRNNRLSHNYKGQEYRGWNSGGQNQTLLAGVPESWATAVVHMFLFRLEHALSVAIEQRLRVRHEADRLKTKAPGDTVWDDLIDIDVSFPKEDATTIKKVLEQELIMPIEEATKAAIEIPIQHRRSALLFGPPGTSKTTLVRALARRIAWPYIEITPSHFLSHGLEQIYVRANEIFEDLTDLSRVVILFDEMDALVQRRDQNDSEKAQQLDVTRQFLTTSMLPKLTKLHDHGRVIFFMATNHQKQFDSAIKRPGRFDLLLCMGPPTWRAKLDGMRALVPREAKPDTAEIANLLRGKTGRTDVQEILNRFTFGDVKSFLEHLCIRTKKSRAQLKEALTSLSEADVEAFVKEWGKSLITLWDDGSGKNVLLSDYKDDLVSSRRQ